MHAPLRALLCALPLLAYAASSPTPAFAYDDAGYLAYADRMQERLDGLWNEQRGIYEPGPGRRRRARQRRAAAHAQRRRAGRARGPGAQRPPRAARRQGARHRARVHRPPPAATRRPGSQIHVPGWSSSMYTIDAGQHLVYDAEIVDGLVHAWKARQALDLPDETARMIADRIHRVAHTHFWRWPTIRLNQVNWYALMYAADATVSGQLGAAAARHARAARALRLRPAQLRPRPALPVPPALRRYARANVDSAEYANIVLSFLRFYNQGRRAGMAPLPRAGRGLVRRWIRRAMAGYWTHAGYMNWDSGLGFERWHQAKKLGLAQQALIGIAQTPRLQPGREWGRWAKWMLDRGLRFYERLPVQEAGLPDPVLFQLFTVPQTVGSARLAAARLEANAARAVEAGLGRMRGERPPSLYAYDPDIGRLAITTPAYNTAIIAVNQRAFPYGGIELARLFDGEQEVAAGIGGRAPAAFGLLVREPSGRRVFSSQTGPLAGRPERHAAAAHARAVGDRRERAHAPGQGVRRAVPRPARPRHVHRRSLPRGHLPPLPAGVDRDAVAADAAARAGAAERSVLLPSWGRGARVVAVLRDGSRVSVRSRAVALARVDHFEVISRRSGYAVEPLRRPPGAVARVMVPSRQSSAPDPGPTLAVELARGASWRRAAFAVRIVVTRR